jgi:hypothetical protein
MSYLAWVLRDCEGISWQLRSEIRALIEKARQDADAARDEEPTAGPPADWSRVISTWYRAMSMRFHPDRSGSTEQMVAVNAGYEKLKELTGG